VTRVLECQGYAARIEFDAEDEVFVGHVLGIADRISFHSARAAELQAAFRAAVDHYLEDCRAIARAAAESGLQPWH
jgi:predicted HicB family RNase H-like nuclease